MKSPFRNTTLLVLLYALYAIHFFARSSHSYPSLFKSYLGDVLCMPIVLSLALLCMQLTYGKRYQALSIIQILSATFLISIYFEVILPQMSKNYVSDFWDVLCYVTGAASFYLFFNPVLKNKSNPLLAQF